MSGNTRGQHAHSPQKTRSLRRRGQTNGQASPSWLCAPNPAPTKAPCCARTATCTTRRTTTATPIPQLDMTNRTNLSQRCTPTLRHGSTERNVIHCLDCLVHRLPSTNNAVTTPSGLCYLPPRYTASRQVGNSWGNVRDTSIGPLR